MSQPVVVTPRGIVRCAYCRTDDYSIAGLGPDRLHDGHVGIRFRDNYRGTWIVLYEGEDVTSLCVEAVAGTGKSGLVYLYEGEWVEEVDPPVFRKVACSLSTQGGAAGHALVAQYRGNVQVVRSPAS